MWPKEICKLSLRVLEPGWIPSKFDYGIQRRRQEFNTPILDASFHSWHQYFFAKQLSQHRILTRDTHSGRSALPYRPQSLADALSLSHQTQEFSRMELNDLISIRGICTVWSRHFFIDTLALQLRHSSRRVANRMRLASSGSTSIRESTCETPTGFHRFPKLSFHTLSLQSIKRAAADS